MSPFQNSILQNHQENIRKSKEGPVQDEMNWMDVYEAKKSEAVALKTEIQKIDDEIDEMVFDLYGLTAEEISIIKNAPELEPYVVGLCSSKRNLKRPAVKAMWELASERL